MFCSALLSWTLQAALYASTSCVVILTLLFAVLRMFRNRTYHALKTFPGSFEEIPLIRQVVRLRSFRQSARTTGIPFGVYITDATFGQIRARQLKNQGAHVEYIAGQPNLIIYQANHVEEIFTHNANIRKGFGYDFLEPWLGSGLLLSAGSMWKTQRKLLTPAFHFKILDEFARVMNRQARIFADRMLKKPNDEDFVQYVSALALDIVCETIMGTSMECQTSDKGVKYLKGIHRLGEIFVDRFHNVSYWNDFMYSFTDDYKELDSILKVLHSFTRKVIEERKAELLDDSEFLSKTTQPDNSEVFAKSKKPFLDMMLHKHLSGELSVEDMRAQVDTFMFAGHDTTSMALTYACYLIGLHPDVQKTLHEEVDQVFAGEEQDCDVTTEHIRELKYMDMVMRESQRILPTVPIIGRTLDQPMEINGKTIPKGTHISVFLANLNYDQHVFPKPDEFIPERFSPEECAKRSPFAFTPFSAGPRNCIGQKFALLEEKIVLVWLLRRYQWRSLDPRDKLELVFEIVQRPKSKIRIEFRARKK